MSNRNGSARREAEWERPSKRESAFFILSPYMAPLSSLLPHAIQQLRAQLAITDYKRALILII